MNNITKSTLLNSSALTPIRRVASVVILASVIVLFPMVSKANPKGGVIVGGAATIATPTADHTVITQTTDKAAINWQSFNIGAGQHTQFIQPSASSITLNRVVGGNPSEILGRLSANGTIMLVNPDGILFGRNSRVDVAGLVASTHDIRTDDFMAGKFNFNIPGKPNASVVNLGTINIADTGIAAFVAPGVRNDGAIIARLGKVTMASANGFTLDLYGDDLVHLVVDDKVATQAIGPDGQPLNAAVDNSGTIKADGGFVVLTANAAQNVVNNVVNHSGVIEARTVSQQNGKIILGGGDNGNVTVSGTIDASGQTNETGGEIRVIAMGGTVELTSTASIKAEGGATGGDGGFIDTSALVVNIDALSEISTFSAFGKTGQWLIDPTNYTIASSGGNITGSQLTSYLNKNHIEIQTLSTGTDNGDIFVNDGVSWSSTNTLTLTAHRNILVNEHLNATGGGNVAMRADSLGSGTGTVTFSGNGHVTANSAASVKLYYNPTSYADASTKSDTNGNPYSTKVTLNGTSTLSAYMLVNDINDFQNITTNTSGIYALGKNIDASAIGSWDNGLGNIPVGNGGSVAYANAETTVVTSGNAQSKVLSGNGKYVVYAAGPDQNPNTLNSHIYRENLITGDVQIVDTDSAGNLSTGDSQQPLDISDDGRYILITLDEYGSISLDPNRTPSNQNNPTGPLYRKDMQTGETIRVDTLSDGSNVRPAWGVGYTAVMSADGNSVVFEHGNTEYAGISYTSGGHSHVYHKNLTTGKLTVVDTNSNGTISSGTTSSGGYGIGISSDGNTVSFLSTNAGDLIGGTSLAQYSSVFTKNLTTGQVTLTNADASGTPSDNNGYGSAAVISGDGRFVAFTSGATNLVSGVSGGPQLYVKNIATGEIVVASKSQSGTLGNAYSGAAASFSKDGRYIVFESWASNLISNDTNGVYDIFVKDLQTGNISRVSESTLGIQVDQHARGPQVSSDGTVITFYTNASSIDPNGNNGSDIFVTTNPLSSDTVRKTLIHEVNGTKTTIDAFSYNVIGANGKGANSSSILPDQITLNANISTSSTTTSSKSENSKDPDEVALLPQEGDETTSPVPNVSTNNGDNKKNNIIEHVANIFSFVELIANGFSNVDDMSVVGKINRIGDLVVQKNALKTISNTLKSSKISGVSGLKLQSLISSAQTADIDMADLKRILSELKGTKNINRVVGGIAGSKTKIINSLATALGDIPAAKLSKILKFLGDAGEIFGMLDQAYSSYKVIKATQDGTITTESIVNYTAQSTIFSTGLLASKTSFLAANGAIAGSAAATGGVLLALKAGVSFGEYIEGTTVSQIVIDKAKRAQQSMSVISTLASNNINEFTSGKEVTDRERTLEIIQAQISISTAIANLSDIIASEASAEAELVSFVTGERTNRRKLVDMAKANIAQLNFLSNNYAQIYDNQMAIGRDIGETRILSQLATELGVN